MMTDRRKDPRSIKINYQERRRQEALEQQHASRAKVLDSRRHLAALLQSEQQTENEDQADDDEEKEEEYDEEYRRPSPQAIREQWASHFMSPEWLVEIPSNLATDWLVLPRPEGQRCLVISSRGQTVSRLRNCGVVLERFHSGLPAGGSGGSGSRGGDTCIVDCIYNTESQTYYVLDMLQWRGHDLYDCTTEFRFFWMHSKLSEDVEHSSPLTKDPSTRFFAPLPTHPATAAGLHAAYADPVPFTRDGLYFVHTKTQYHPGQTSLALTWKDALSSRFFVDTDAKGVVPPHQHMVLQYQGEEGGRAVATGDDPPVTLAIMPLEFVQKVKGKLVKGRLLRFRLGSGGIQFREGTPVGADLHYVGVANQRRGRSDSLSKILFQMLARTQPLTIEALMEAAKLSEAVVSLSGNSGVEVSGSIGVVSSAAAVGGGVDSSRGTAAGVEMTDE